MSLGVVLLFMTLTFLTLTAMAGVSITRARLTASGRDRVIALSLAEAGIDDTIDQLRLNNAYAGTTYPTNVTNEDDVIIGTFAVQTTTIDPNNVDVLSTGKTTTGKKCQVRVRVNMSGFSLGNGAMISNGNLKIAGGVVVKTDPVDSHDANVLANGNITTNGMVAYIDGRVAAGGTASIPAGISTDPAYPNGQSGAPPIAFPSASTIDTWKSRWISEAQAGDADTAETGISLVNTQTMTITAPEYINGNITMTGSSKLTILGTGPVYVNGYVSMTGTSQLVNGTNLIVRDYFNQAGNSSASPIYEAGTIANTYPALITLSTDPLRAINVVGKATNNQFSVMYAVYGGVNCGGSSTVRGSLVAGGAGATLESRGDYTHIYPSHSLGSVKLGNIPTVASWVEL